MRDLSQFREKLINAQADLSLCWAYRHFVGFVMSWPNYCSRLEIHLPSRGAIKVKDLGYKLYIVTYWCLYMPRADHILPVFVAKVNSCVGPYRSIWCGEELWYSTVGNRKRAWNMYGKFNACLVNETSHTLFPTCSITRGICRVT